MTEVALRQILAGFAEIGRIKADSIEIGEPMRGYRNLSYKVGDDMNLIIAKREEWVIRRLDLADWYGDYAAKKGLATRKRVGRGTAILKSPKTGREAGYARLYNYLPGETIPWEAWSMKHVKLLGWAMGDLHRVWRTSPENMYTLPDAIDGLVELMGQIQKYLTQEEVVRALEVKLGVKMFGRAPDFFVKTGMGLDNLRELPKQPLHLDLVRGNVLFREAKKSVDAKWVMDGVELSGIIDFEKVAKGPVVLDLARTYAFLMADCNKPPVKIAKYLCYDGYYKRSVSKRIVIPSWLTNLYLLHDFYKFLRHNPYESLEENYHYKRTRDILKERGVLEVKRRK
ncbi:phosphotransferase [Candidatus Saccharibacteria bacterium]|nr:phosphotransferase [Candidatus Saccharibacteria bacterium]